MSKLIIGLIALALYLVLKYHDTSGFQSAMKFLFNPDSRLALPQYWQDKRMMMIAGLLLLLLLYYKRTWCNYFKLSQIYRGSEPKVEKPPLSALQASYFFHQDKVRYLLTWLIDSCKRGLISLHYSKGPAPWSIELEADTHSSQIDRQQLNAVFKKDAIVPLKAWMSDPDDKLQSLADDLYAEAKQKAEGQSQHRQSSLPAWLALAALIAEIPFYNASLAGENPGILAIVVFASLLSAVPAYAFTYNFPLFFTESKTLALAMLIAACLFTLLGLWMIFSSSHFSGIYTAAALYPGLMISMILLIMKQPVLPENDLLLSQIIGYRKYLARDSYSISEKDLPWTLAMGIHSDIGDKDFHYGGQELPPWLKTKESDVQTVMKTLHLSLYRSINEAVHGRVEPKNRLSVGRNRDRRL